MSWLRSPALHMLAIGALAFGLSTLRGAAEEVRPRIVIPEHRVALALRGVVGAAERAEVIEALIDEEVLYRYALALGMHENPAAQRRLAKIAEFVEANPHQTGSETDRAAAAIELGLHHGDLVVRRILVDGARRLIRAVVLVRTPSDESLEAYLAAHPEPFRRPARVRLSQIAVNGFRWPDSEARARQLLERLHQEPPLDLDAALALSDESFASARLPLLTEQALATKLGTDFAAAAMALPEGGWAGPIASRYGHHLVYVHQRREAYVPPLAEVRDGVEQRLLHELADRWLARRLRELRQEFEVVVPDVVGSGGVA